MNNIIVLYKSRYGATKKYAEWLSDEFKCELIEIKNAKISEIEKYSTIILGGGIYASGIAGLSFIRKNYKVLKDKKLVVFAVGASPFDEKNMNALKSHNFKNEIAGIPCFYCRGAWNEDAMTFRDKMLCKMLKKAVSKKDPSVYEPWEAALMEAIGSNFDWTDKVNLTPILEHVRVDRFTKPKSSITLDQLMQGNYEQKYFKECKYIWQKYVPKQGQSKVLQGELLREIEKLRCEAKDNGNINWDEDFTFFCDFIKDVLCDQEIYSNDEKTRITLALDYIKKCGEYANRYNNGQISDDKVHINKIAYVKDNLYDIVADAIGKFQLKNSEPIPHAKLDHVKR